jgi:hypothetical protein
VDALDLRLFDYALKRSAHPFQVTIVSSVSTSCGLWATPGCGCRVGSGWATNVSPCRRSATPTSRIPQGFFRDLRGSGARS